jgi:cob(I)alamin adenosyltransferase
MSITTGTGDGGSTSLWTGERVPKDHPRIEALGELDELSSLLAFARHACRLDEAGRALDALQRPLARAAAELASLGRAPPEPIGPGDCEAILEAIRGLEARVPLRGFVLPGRTEASARIDLARAAARRLERRVVSLVDGPGCGPPRPDSLLRYLNGLSDYLFMLARSEEAAEGKLRYAKDPGGKDA